MKIKVSLTIVLLGISSIFFSQKNVVSEVDKVVVFSQGAQIERNINVKLSVGENILRFVNLEKSINANTIQVYGSEDVTIISNDFSLKNRDEDFIPKAVKSIKEEIKMLDRKIAFANNRVGNFKSEKQMILSNKNVKGNNEGLIIDDLMDLAEYYREELNTIDSLIFEENLKLIDLRKEVNELNQELTDKGYSGSMGVIEVKVIAKKSASVRLKLTYIANNVSWAPFYDIKSSGIGQPLKMILRGTITQNTGVNWKDVDLALSTSTPLNYGVIPEVHPWTLYFRNTYGKKKKSYGNKSYEYQPNVLSNAAYSISSTGTPAGGYSTLADFTRVTESMTNREFSVDLPYNIKGQNGKAVVEIDRFEMKSDYMYYTAPKFDKNVYLLANVDEWEQFNLLPGTANIFLKGTYVGNTFIDPSEVTDTMSLLLGKDLDITADRKKVKDYCKKSFVGAKKTTELGLQVVIQNKKSKNVKIMIEDQVPISNTEDIEVKILDKSKAKLEVETGKLTWEYTLKSGETKKHLIRYEVKYPKNKVIENL